MVLLQSKIKQAETDIEEYRKVISFITVYQGHFAISKFKADKVTQYQHMLYMISVRSVHNAALAAELANLTLAMQE